MIEEGFRIVSPRFIDKKNQEQELYTDCGGDLTSFISYNKIEKKMVNDCLRKERQKFPDRLFVFAYFKGGKYCSKRQKTYDEIVFREIPSEKKKIHKMKLKRAPDYRWGDYDNISDGDDSEEEISNLISEIRFKSYAPGMIDKFLLGEMRNDLIMNFGSKIV